MGENICKKCRKSSSVLSKEGLCYHCDTSKEKTLFLKMINQRTILLSYSILLYLFFLLNAIPTVRCVLYLTKQYSNIPNQYIKYGKDILILSVYGIIKLLIGSGIIKKRYLSEKSRYLHPASELVLFLVKSSLLASLMNHPVQWQQRIHSLTDKLDPITDEQLSSVYLAFLLVFGGIFLLLRVLACIIACVANVFQERQFQDFYHNFDHAGQIGHLAHMEFYLRHHVMLDTSKQTPYLAAKMEPSMQYDQEFLKTDLGSYITDEKKLVQFVLYLLSNEDMITVKEEDILLYYSYIKDKLSQWQDQNTETENHLDQEIIQPFLSQYQSILSAYANCGVEGAVSFELANSYATSLETPMKLLLEQRKQVKQRIDELYFDSGMRMLAKREKETVNHTIALFDRQVINLSDLTLIIDEEEMQYDNILITNRGVFILTSQTFDPALSFELLIEKDGSWWQRTYDENNLPLTVPVDMDLVKNNDRYVLKLEKLINHKLERSLDQYLEFAGITILTNDQIRIENHSTQTLLCAAELIGYIRRYSIIYSEEQMITIRDLILASVVPQRVVKIPNYRKLILDKLDDLLTQKLDLLYRNTKLLHQTEHICKKLKIHRASDSLPLIVLNNYSGITKNKTPKTSK